jgi:putative ABC transport system substrate-binding protein
MVAAFRQGLSETGYVEGQNLGIEYRWAEFQYDRLPALAADLVARKVEVIATNGDPRAATAAKNATSTIPIVFSAISDPVAFGLVASLARPGGNLTGVSPMNTELMPKRLELLSELVPRAGVIALLVNPSNSSAERRIRDVQEAARTKGVQLPVLKPAAKARSMLPLPLWPNCKSARSSSTPTRFSSAGATNSWHWRHAMPFRRSTHGTNSPPQVA